MIGIHDYGVFVAAGVALNLTPGQDSLYIAGRSLAQGKAAGVASALGVATGSLVHVAAAALGLSVVLASSARAFAVVKWLGAAYLIYMGIRMLLDRSGLESLTTSGAGPGRLRAAYGRGILTNVLNPKVAVFFLAFLPQFVDPAASHLGLAFLLLGGTFVVTGTLWCLVIAVVAARASGFLRSSARTARLVRTVSGGVFVALGVKLALDRPE